MPKKGASEKQPSVRKEAASEKKKKPIAEQQKLGHEINEMVSSKMKRKKPEAEEIEKLREDTKPGDEIDEIFSSMKKRKKSEAEQEEKQKEATSTKPMKEKKKKSKARETDEFFDPPPRPRKKTGDGLVIYTEEELGIGRSDGGDTPLCPFDCSCCF